jgi:RHS repeat-associated protein
MIGTTGTVAYNYDLNGDVTSIGYPSTGAVARNFDDAGRLISIVDWKATNNQTTFGYDANGNLTAINYPNGIVASTSYGPANRPTSIADALGGTTLGSFAYQYTGGGLVSAVTPAGVAQPNETYSYDNRNRIITDSSGSTSYNYDNANNPIQLMNGTAQGFNEASQLCWTGPTNGSGCSSTPSGDNAYGYDAQGNRTQLTPPAGTATAYTYDQGNRLTSFGPSGGAATASYSYNTDSLRIAKTVSSGTTNYTWDTASSMPLLLQEQTGSSTTSYIYGPNQVIIEQLTGSNPTYLHADQLGSTRLLSDAAGAVIGSYSYDPYGAIPAGWKTGTGTTPFQFAGQYTDSESGLQYLRSRYYDPAIGQFINRDPLTSITHSPYGYSADNPLNEVDPNGLSWFNPFSWSAQTWGTVAAGVGLAAGAVALCAATACIGDIAAAAGATTLEGTLAAAETTSTIADATLTGSAIVGGAADTATAYQRCSTYGYVSSSCALAAGGVGLDVATFGVGKRVIPPESIWSPIYSTLTAPLGWAYGAATDWLSGGDSASVGVQQAC